MFRMMLPATVLVALLVAPPASAQAPKDKEQPKPPRPPQTAVLAKNTAVKADVAYGLHVLSRLMSADTTVAGAVAERVRELAPLVTGLADSIILRYAQRPFGVSYALKEPISRVLAQLMRIQAASTPAAG